MYYMLRETDSDKFGVGGNGGQIEVKAGGITDHEAKTWQSVTVNASDKKDSEGKAGTVAPTPSALSPLSNPIEPGGDVLRPA